MVKFRMSAGETVFISTTPWQVRKTLTILAKLFCFLASLSPSGSEAGFLFKLNTPRQLSRRGVPEGGRPVTRQKQNDQQITTTTTPARTLQEFVLLCE